MLVGGADGVTGLSGQQDGPYFTGPCGISVLPGIGHNLPQEAPARFADAVLGLSRS